MPVLDNYLFFNGNCAEAMRYYERTLGGKIEMMMTYAQSPQPDHCPAGSQDRIMHARLVLDGRALMASDTPVGQPNPGMNGFALSLNYPAPAEARRVFDALAAGGKVTMPMQKTFWSEAYGMLTDRFGTPWMVGGGMPAEHIEEGYEHRGVGKDEAQQRAWATVNKETGGGKKSGSGLGKAMNTGPSKGGQAGGRASASRTPEERSASARKAAATRKRNAQPR